MATKRNLIGLLLVLIVKIVFSQVSINTDGSEANSAAMLDIVSTSKGILIPRMSTTQRTNILSPVSGLLVFDETTASFWFYKEGTSEWIELISTSSQNSKINDLSDAISDGTCVFLGSGSGINNDGNNSNTAVGISSQSSNTSGIQNTSLGLLSLSQNTSGSRNISIGYSAMSLSTGADNIGIGIESLSSCSGNDNIGIGKSSLSSCSGNDNTGIGLYSLTSLGSGIQNIAIGNYSGYNLTGSSHGNVFLGYKAGFSETGNDKLYIDNCETSEPLIGGDFSTNQLDVNGTIKITGGNPGNNKVLSSDANGLSSWKDINNLNLIMGINDLSDGKTDNNDNVFVGQNCGDLSNLNSRNTGLGVSALQSSSSKADNTAVGYQALHATTNSRNTAVGSYSLESNDYGYDNSAFGYNAMGNNDSGNSNTVIGSNALLHNEIGDNNTIIGAEAGYNSSGNSNTGCVFIGYQAGYWETEDNKLYIENSNISRPLIGGDFYNDTVSISGDLKLYGQLKITGGNPSTDKVLTSDANGNASWQETGTPSHMSLNDLDDGIDDDSSVFLGFRSGSSDDASDNQNTALGSLTLNNNTSGSFNTGIGWESLQNNTIGEYNVGLGHLASNNNTRGSRNTSIGGAALINNINGNNNTAAGYESGPNSSGYSNTTSIGYQATTTASNEITIGNSSITQIGGYAAWTNLSDRRFKNKIKENVSGLDFIMKLRPITYHLNVRKLNNFLGIDNNTLDRKAEKLKETIQQTGFIAQEVEQAAKEVGYDFSGVNIPKNDQDHYSLAYAEFVVPLVKAVQEQQEQIKTQQYQIETQERQILAQQNIINNIEMEIKTLKKQLQ